MNLNGADLTRANLERALLSRADLFDTRLAGARLEGTVFGNAQINERTFQNLSLENSVTGDSLTACLVRLILGPTGRDAYRCVYDPTSQYDLFDTDPKNTERWDDQTEDTQTQKEDDLEVRAGGVYRQFEQLAAENALPDWERRFFILRQEMQTRQKTGISYLFALLYRTLFGYGEGLYRVIGWSITTIVIWACFYLIGGLVRPVKADGSLGRPLTWTQAPKDPSVLWESLYYSTLTFTALGFGDFRPTETMGQLLTVVETTFGAILIALLVFVLGRRAAR